MHDALQNHVIEELAGRQTLAADDAIVELGDPLLAYVDPGAAELGLAPDALANNAPISRLSFLST